MVAYVLAFVCIIALLAAFVAQWLRPLHRTKNIFAMAAMPSALLIGAMAIYAPVVGVDQSWFQAVVTLAFWFVVFMFVGLVGAIVGTEMASLVTWILRRRTD